MGPGTWTYIAALIMGIAMGIVVGYFLTRASCNKRPKVDPAEPPVYEPEPGKRLVLDPVLGLVYDYEDDSLKITK